MIYALIQDGAVLRYPFDPTLLRGMHPSVSFSRAISDEALAGFGVFPVVQTRPPAVTDTQELSEDTPALVKGAWAQQWLVTDLTPEQIAAKLAAAQRKALNALAALRYERETAGIAFGGTTIPTDRQTCAILTGAYVRADKDPAFVIKFKSPDGTFTPIDAPTIIAVGDAVTAHVQACFSNEAALSAAIKAAPDFATLKAIDTGSGWPG